MKGSRCRLFDENLVRHIMVSTGLSLIRHMKENGVLDADDICDFIDANAEEIIDTTIDDMSGNESDEADEAGGWREHDEPPSLEDR